MRKVIAALVLGSAAATAFCADTYPVRPIRMIIPASPGSGSDYFGRTVAQALSEQYRQQVIADNRAGAGGLIGASLIAASTPDGYNIGVASSSLVVAPLFQINPPYRPIADFAPIALMSSITSVLAVAPGVPARTVKEFIALVKAKPGQFNYASIGAGTAAHLSAEIFNRAAGLDVVHVPFKTVADSYSEMYANRVHYVVYVAPAAMPGVRDGRLRALAVTSAKRFGALPDVPTMAEAGLPAAEVETMFGLVAPAATPRAVIAKLHADIVGILRRPETRERFERQGGEPAVETTPASYAKLLQAEYDRYRKLIPEIGLKPQ
jgi:tripartite-type tricarboxylate transporter receptor subunit TctC